MSIRKSVCLSFMTIGLIVSIAFNTKVASAKQCSISLNIDTASVAKDFEGNRYQYVKIDEQTWLNANMNTKYYRNGTPIPQAKTSKDWLSFGKKKIGCWCYYNFDSVMGPVLGKLYNSYAAFNAEFSIAPSGFRVPNYNDVCVLMNSVDSIGAKMKAVAGWNNCIVKSPDGKLKIITGNGTNASEFNALPAGYLSSAGIFMDSGNATRWWYANTNLSERNFFPRGMLVSSCEEFVISFPSADGPLMGYSIRCIKDK